MDGLSSNNLALLVLGVSTVYSTDYGNNTPCTIDGYTRESWNKRGLVYVESRNLVNEHGVQWISYTVTCLHNNYVVQPLWSLTKVWCDSRTNTWFTNRTDGLDVDRWETEDILLTDLQCVIECPPPNKIRHGTIFLGSYDYLITHEGLTNREAEALKPSFYINPATGDNNTKYKPSARFNFYCNEGYQLSTSANTTVCQTTGNWLPTVPTCLKPSETESKKSHSTFGNSIDTVTVVCSCVAIVVILVVIVLVIIMRAKLRLICNKRTPRSERSTDTDCPHGYMQFDSETDEPPSYHDVIRDDELSSHANLRLTSRSTYSPIVSRESSSRGDGSSLSRGETTSTHSTGTGNTYRHSIYSRGLGVIDTESLYLGDQLSMSDNSTLVTVNTYDSSNLTASNPSLTNLRRNQNESRNENRNESQTDSIISVNSLDDTPLISQSQEQEDNDQSDHQIA